MTEAEERDDALLAPALAVERCAGNCEREAEHIQDNANALRKWADTEHEARCRELCSMYLKEFAFNLRTTVSPTALDEVRGMREDAERFRALLELAGYWQDGSHQAVVLDQDECTHMCYVRIGKKRYGTDNSSFRAAIDEARRGK